MCSFSRLTSPKDLHAESSVPTLGSPLFTLAKPIPLLRNMTLDPTPYSGKGKKSFTNMRTLTIKCPDRIGFR